MRIGKQAFIVDTDGIYAPVRVDGDHMTPNVAANLDKLTEGQATIMFEVVRQSPFLSPEGRRERLRHLLRSGKVRLVFSTI